MFIINCLPNEIIPLILHETDKDTLLEARLTSKAFNHFIKEIFLNTFKELWNEIITTEKRIPAYHIKKIDSLVPLPLSNSTWKVGTETLQVRILYNESLKFHFKIYTPKLKLNENVVCLTDDLIHFEETHLKLIDKRTFQTLAERKLPEIPVNYHGTEKGIYLGYANGNILKMRRAGADFIEAGTYSTQFIGPFDFLESQGSRLLAAAEKKLCVVEEQTKNIYYHSLNGIPQVFGNSLIWLENNTLQAVDVDQIREGEEINGKIIYSNVLSIIKGDDRLLLQMEERIVILDKNFKWLGEREEKMKVTAFASKENIGAYGKEDGTLTFFEYPIHHFKECTYPHGQIRSLSWNSNLQLLASTEKGRCLLISPCSLEAYRN